MDNVVIDKYPEMANEVIDKYPEMVNKASDDDFSPEDLSVKVRDAAVQTENSSENLISRDNLQRMITDLIYRHLLRNGRDVKEESEANQGYVDKKTIKIMDSDLSVPDSITCESILSKFANNKEDSPADLCSFQPFTKPTKNEEVFDQFWHGEAEDGVKNTLGNFGENFTSGTFERSYIADQSLSGINDKLSLRFLEPEKHSANQPTNQHILSSFKSELKEQNLPLSACSFSSPAITQQPLSRWRYCSEASSPYNNSSSLQNDFSHYGNPDFAYRSLDNCFIFPPSMPHAGDICPPSKSLSSSCYWRMMHPSLFKKMKRSADSEIAPNQGECDVVGSFGRSEIVRKASNCEMAQRQRDEEMFRKFEKDEMCRRPGVDEMIRGLRLGEMATQLGEPELVRRQADYERTRKFGGCEMLHTQDEGELVRRLKEIEKVRKPREIEIARQMENGNIVRRSRESEIERVPGSDNLISGGLTKGEKVIQKFHIPLSLTEITLSSMDKFNDLLYNHKLTDEQVNVCRELRRRGKNKIAAQNCRKRKVEQLKRLEKEVEMMRMRKEILLKERLRLQVEQRQWEERNSRMEARILRRLEKRPGQWEIRVEWERLKVVNCEEEEVLKDEHRNSQVSCH